jgi:hypothetical protein
LSLASSTNLVVVLLAASALIGAIAALRFKVFVLAPIALLISLVSAAVLHMNDFGAGSGVAIVIACLVLNQAAYLIVHVYTCSRRGLGTLLAASLESSAKAGEISKTITAIRSRPHLLHSITTRVRMALLA